MEHLLQMQQFKRQYVEWYKTPAEMVTILEKLGYNIKEDILTTRGWYHPFENYNHKEYGYYLSILDIVRMCVIENGKPLYIPWWFTKERKKAIIEASNF